MMRKTLLFITAIAVIALSGASAAWSFNSGSTGADGAFNPTADIEVQLPADGILNYTTVNIPAGVTVTFTKNFANTPVYLLATGDVTIAGTISVNGTNASGIYSGKGGPGGFDGGLGGTYAVAGGKGLGPGGGGPGGGAADGRGYGGGGGGYGTAGTQGGGGSAGAGGVIYGNSRIMPMIGGSGAGGGCGSLKATYLNAGGAGGGGGGAVLIASSGTITVTGSITANGGNGAMAAGAYGGSGGSGSGGSIKLIADIIAGEGAISANRGNGGAGGSYIYAGGLGGTGKVRLEANIVTRTAATSPAYTYGYPSAVFVSNVPTLRITAVGGVNVPQNPSGQYGSPDVVLPSSTTNPVTVDISASNIPVGTQVTVTSVSEVWYSATATSGGLAGTLAASTASVDITLNASYQCILMAQATYTLQASLYWDDEKIEKVRVATSLGGGSEAVYITESGKEIKAIELMARLMK